MGTLLACWMKILTLDRELSSIRFVGHTVSDLKTMTAAPTTSLRRRKKCRRPTMSTLACLGMRTVRPKNTLLIEKKWLISGQHHTESFC
ncbi:hypothetical protein, partial [Pseudomonas viridiflava]|uniref:hypothetical protein n=1 Tax=Pseudomonas viridiflava TaxID=33069 RepID=UPI0019D0C261